MNPKTLRAPPSRSFRSFRRLAGPLVWVAIVVAHAAACSSSSSLDPTGLPPGRDSGGGGTSDDASDDTSITPYDAAGTPLVKCGSMTCPRGDICIVGNSDTDAGADYHCKGFPAACAGTLTCSCASALCDPGNNCQGADAGVLTCEP
jgi:hypothetical protein